MSPAGSPSILVRVIRGGLCVWAAVLILAIYPYTNDPCAPVKQVLTVLVTAAICAVFFLEDRRGKGVWHLAPGLGLLAAFLGWHLVAALFSSYPLYGLHTLRFWLAGGLTAAVAAQVCTSPKVFWRIVTVIVAASAAASIYGYVQYGGWDPFPWAMRDIEEYRGLPSTFGNPNFAGHALLLALILCGGLFAYARGWGKMAVATAAVLVGGHLCHTRMRGVGAALMVAGMVVLFAAAGRRFRVAPRRVAAAFCIAGLVAGSLGMGAVFVGIRQVQGEGPLPLDSSLVLRLNGYDGAAKMALDRPLAGFGPGVYALENPRYWTPDEARWYALEGRKNNHVHCDVLETAVDAGFPGVFLYLALLVQGVFAALALGGRGKGFRIAGVTLAACFAAFAVDGLFGFNLRVPVSGGLFFLLYGMLSGLSTSGRPTAARHGARLVPAGLLAGALVLAGYEAWTFQGEILFQRGHAALEWASRQDPGAERQAALEQARDAFAKAGRGRGWDGRFAERQAEVYMTSGEWAAAGTYFERALAAQPSHPGWPARLAAAHIHEAVRLLNGGLPMTEEAQQAFEAHLSAAEAWAEHAQRLCPVSPAAEEALGRAALVRATAWTGMGRDAGRIWPQAAIHFRAAVCYGSADPAGLLVRAAQSEAQAGQTEEAEQTYRHAGEYFPDAAALWAGFGEFAQSKGRFDAYEDALNKALQRVWRRPDQGDMGPDRQTTGMLLEHLARVYWTVRQSPEFARRCLREALDMTPGAEEAWGRYLACFPDAEKLGALRSAANGISEEELPGLTASLRAYRPESEDLLSFPGQLYRIATQEFQSKPLIQARADIAARFSWAADILAQALDEAAAHADARQGDAYRMLGEIYVCAGQWEKAERRLTQAIDLLAEETRLPAYLGRSAAWAELGRTAEALEDARKAESLAPDNVNVRANLAQRLAEAGAYAEARFHYTGLLMRVSPDSPLHRELQQALAALDEKEREAEGAP